MRGSAVWPLIFGNSHILRAPRKALNSNQGSLDLAGNLLRIQGTFRNSRPWEDVGIVIVLSWTPTVSKTVAESISTRLTRPLRVLGP